MIPLNEFSAESIAQRMKNKLKNPASKIEGSLAMDNILPLSQEISRIVLMRFFDGLDLALIDTATGDWLDRSAKDYQMFRNLATTSSGRVKFMGEAQTIIPKETIIISEDLEFITITSAVISSDGFVYVEAICKTPGLVSNVDKEMISALSPLNDIAGVTVINENAFTGGTDEEDDEHFRNRIFEKIRNPSGAGNEKDYVRWAKEVAGVGNAICLPCYEGNGRVGVVILSDQGGIPDDQIMDNVYSHIIQKRPTGANVIMIKAEPKEVIIDCTITLSNGYSKQSVEEQFKALLNTFIMDRPFGANKEFSFYKVSDLLFNIEGVEDVIDYFINGEKKSVMATAKEFFDIKEVTINVN